MFGKLTLVATASALALTVAIAQTPGVAPKAPGTQLGGSKVNIIASQKPDQLLASKFKGTEVIGSDNQKIGGVSDILFERDGKITAYVVGIGGFLGMGAKEIALDPKSVEMMPGQNGTAPTLRVAMNKDELTQATPFERYQPPRPLPTQPLSTNRPPMGGGMRPPATQ